MFTCKGCNKEHKRRVPQQKYCSKNCRQNYSYFIRVYGITKDEVQKIADKQGGVCAICNTEGFTMATYHKNKLCVDHCHTTGKVRGLLCHNCNRALGLLQDNTDNLKRAIEYLKEEL